MKTPEMNVFLAKFGGWVKREYHWVTNCGVKAKSFYWVSDEGELSRECPDISNDLNLINRVERKLSGKQHEAFRKRLYATPLSDRDYLSSTARDRAEAIHFVLISKPE